MKGDGLPHSEIAGSKPVDGSPKLIAVFRVLHRLLMPRHPSCARIRLARFVFVLRSFMRRRILAYISIYVAILLNFQLPVFKDRLLTLSGERGHSLSNLFPTRKGVF